MDYELSPPTSIISLYNYYTWIMNFELSAAFSLYEGYVRNQYNYYAHFHVYVILQVSELGWGIAYVQ